MLLVLIKVLSDDGGSFFDYGLRRCEVYILLLHRHHLWHQWRLQLWFCYYLRLWMACRYIVLWTGRDDGARRWVLWHCFFAFNLFAVYVVVSIGKDPIDCFNFRKLIRVRQKGQRSVASWYLLWSLSTIMMQSSMCPYAPK
jgi:hypothetical protein